MKKFIAKKLLVLGTSVGSTDIVKYAQSEGAYVIVTDYLPVEKSAAKQIADETAMISTTDVKKLCEFAKEKNIDGVFCGVSETNLLSVCSVASVLNLPCYFTLKQWEICQNKSLFKDLCCRFNLPVARKFEIGDNLNDNTFKKIEYPVIVKPTDQSSGIGIHVCYNDDELKEGYEDAKKRSFSHQVIVEKYIKGNEFSAVYTVSNGEYRLSMMGDKYLNRDQKGLLPLPEAYVYPSKYLGYYIDNINEKVIKMFHSIGIMNGIVFVQGVTDGKNTALFEAGLRMPGTAVYRFTDYINNVNIMKRLTDFALTGVMEADLSLEDPTLKGRRCCLLSILNAGGKVGQIEGIKEAISVPGVIDSEVRYQVGDEILKSGTLKQSHIRFFVFRETMKDLQESIQQIQGLISVKDNYGNNMLLSNFDVDHLRY